ncbi:MAG: helix-turn-helix domain-containing protein [Treponema sp.]|jgi:transcriptional regulator with XRE-family HTH domain|nr:helix-turn-helix domain-containing protein [Treponema sp.]
MNIQAVFAENMKKYRKMAKLTQEKLAELCGTDYRYIGQIETGVRCPSLDYAEKIASALKIAPYRLFYNEEYKENEALISQQKEQKLKLKTKLFENFSQICSLIDES